MAKYIKVDDSLLVYLSQEAYEQVQKVPAADVRPVVLCQACKHWTRESDESWLGEPGWGSCFNDRYWGMENSFTTPETFYCADGERRDTND